jgi:O-methyltransferase
MLLKTLRDSAKSVTRRLYRAAPSAAQVLPYEIEEEITGLHSRAPLERHLDILLGDVRFGTESFPALYRRCLADTGTQVTPYNVFQRFIGRLHLLRYFLAGLALQGARAEVGVYRGASALLMCRAARSAAPGFDGAGFFLIDSFAGASAAAEQDLIAVRAPDGSIGREPFFSAGGGSADAESVRRALAEFPRASVVQGWVPEVLSTLPAERWAFVHLDVNLYRPTLAALEFFWPRLLPGGAIVADDYGSPFTPGAKNAWHAFAQTQGVPFIVLGERQAVLLKE